MLEDVDREGLIEAAVGEGQAARISLGEGHLRHGGVGEERCGVAAHHQAHPVGVPDSVLGRAAAIVEHHVGAAEAQHTAQRAVAHTGGEQGRGQLAVVELLGELGLVGDILRDIVVRGGAGHQVDVARVEAVAAGAAGAVDAVVGHVELARAAGGALKQREELACDHEGTGYRVQGAEDYRSESSFATKRRPTSQAKSTS